MDTHVLKPHIPTSFKKVTGLCLHWKPPEVMTSKNSSKRNRTRKGKCHRNRAVTETGQSTIHFNIHTCHQLVFDLGRSSTRYLSGLHKKSIRG